VLCRLESPGDQGALDRFIVLHFELSQSLLDLRSTEGFEERVIERKMKDDLAAAA
jgi:hypothetical protein